MGLFTQLFGGGGIHSPAGGGILWGGGYSTDSGSAVSEWNAATIPAVYACVGLISDAIAQLPIRVYRKDRNGNREHLTDHRVEHLLNRRPNPRMTAFAFRKTSMSHVLLWGNGYSHIQRVGRGEPAALWLALPDRTQPYLNDAGELMYRTTLDMQNKEFESPEIMHIPGMGFDGIVGYSPVAVARQAMGLAKAQESFGAKFFGNDSKSGGFLKHPGRLSDEAKRNIRESMDRQGGPDNSHRLKILEEGMEYQQTTINPEDAQFLECVMPGTRIDMADGTQKLAEDIREGDTVIGWDDGLTKARVAKVFPTREKSIVRVRTYRGRSIDVTSDHPFLCKESMRTPGGRQDKRGAGWVHAGDLKPGNMLAVALGSVHEAAAPQDFDEGWLFGFMVGDASIRRAGLTFTTADEEIVERVEQVAKRFGGGVNQTAPIQYYLSKGGAGCKPTVIKDMFRCLEGSNSYNKRVPDSVMKGGRDAWIGFLSGYLDADGSVSDTVIYWASTSRDLLEDCRHMLAMLGIESAIYKQSEEGESVVMGKTCRARACYGLYITGAPMLSLAADTLMPVVERKAIGIDHHRGKTSKYRPENWMYDRVKSVEYLGESSAIGIEIDAVHTHVTNGLISHNSRDFQVAEIARIYRVPLHMIQSVSGSTSWGSGIAEMSMGFVRFTLAPWLTPLEQEMGNKLLTAREREQGVYIRHDTSDLLRGDLADRSSYYEKALNPDTGWLTREEVRAAEDRDPLPENDQTFARVDGQQQLQELRDEITSMALDREIT